MVRDFAIEHGESASERCVSCCAQLRSLLFYEMQVWDLEWPIERYAIA